MRGIGIEPFVHVAFDSDGDTDADPDACGKGSRPGSSWFLTVSGSPPRLKGGEAGMGY